MTNIPGQGEKYQDLDVVEEESIQDIYNPKVKFSESVIQQENNTFKEMTKQDVSYPRHSSQVSPQRDKCAVCLQKFGFMVKTKEWYNDSLSSSHCKLSVCEKHSRKKRIEPVSQQFKRICDICEDELLIDLIDQEYNEDNIAHEKELEESEQEQQITIQKLKALELEDSQMLELVPILNYNQQLTEKREKALTQLSTLQSEINMSAEQLQQTKNQRLADVTESTISIQQDIMHLQKTCQAKTYLLQTKYLTFEYPREDQLRDMERQDIALDGMIEDVTATIKEISRMITEQDDREQLRLKIQNDLLTFKNSISDKPSPQESKVLPPIAGQKDEKMQSEKACDFCKMF